MVGACSVCTETPYRLSSGSVSSSAAIDTAHNARLDCSVAAARPCQARWRLTHGRGCGADGQRVPGTGVPDQPDVDKEHDHGDCRQGKKQTRGCSWGLSDAAGISGHGGSHGHFAAAAWPGPGLRGQRAVAGGRGGRRRAGFGVCRRGRMVVGAPADGRPDRRPVQRQQAKSGRIVSALPRRSEVRGLPRHDRRDGVQARRGGRRHARPRPRRTVGPGPAHRQARVLREGADPLHPGSPHAGRIDRREETLDPDGQPGRLQRPRDRERVGRPARRNPDDSHVGRPRRGAAPDAYGHARGARLPELGPVARPGGLSALPPGLDAAFHVAGLFLRASGLVGRISGPRSSRQ